MQGKRLMRFQSKTSVFKILYGVAGSSITTAFIMQQFFLLPVEFHSHRTTLDLLYGE